ncbi:hypothetical protein [Hymenobacter mucosus]|uniref:Uncharacterized protein n=1 Tax=Hymenobacter mucosus TaxID=1411120 RepID=A0A239A8G7_9BACT|nr:hypothetical protein [Hymenobacter mucosus]SNR91611.1 hypothetical protein SAMN06269173_11142 [Hymenobacter mucosus]
MLITTSQAHYAQYEAYEAAYSLVIGTGNAAIAAKLRTLATESWNAYRTAWNAECDGFRTRALPVLTDEEALTYAVVGEVFHVELSA